MKLFRVEIIRVLRVGISTRTWAFITVRSPECVSVNNFKRVVNTHTQTPALYLRRDGGRKLCVTQPSGSPSCRHSKKPAGPPNASLPFVGSAFNA